MPALQAPVYEEESLECTMLLIRAWSSHADLSESIRTALLMHPQANVAILPGLGVMVLGPSMQALQRRTAIVERLICLAAGGTPTVSSTAPQGRGVESQTHARLLSALPGQAETLTPHMLSMLRAVALYGIIAGYVASELDYI